MENPFSLNSEELDMIYGGTADCCSYVFYTTGSFYANVADNYGLCSGGGTNCSWQADLSTVGAWIQQAQSKGHCVKQIWNS